MRIFTIQWRSKEGATNTDVAAINLEEAKRKVVKDHGVKYSNILPDGAWR